MAGLLSGVEEYLGKNETIPDVVTPLSVARLAATLDVDNPAPNAGDPLPLGWECAYFVGGARPDALGEDGLPSATGLLPPIDLPRRMFGGARHTYRTPLRIGEEIAQTTELVDIEEKETRSGPLVRALLRRTIAGPRGPAVTEEQDILYLGEVVPGTPAPPAKPAPEAATWRRSVVPSPILLFRFSAITFNAHRIHYDLPYASEVENYPGLLVQGRLLALLLLELCRANKPEERVTSFGYRAVRPLYDQAPFTLGANPDDDGYSLWVSDSGGSLTMTGTAQFG